MTISFVAARGWCAIDLSKQSPCMLPCVLVLPVDGRTCPQSAVHAWLPFRGSPLLPLARRRVNVCVNVHTEHISLGAGWLKSIAWRTSNALLTRRPTTTTLHRLSASAALRRAPRD